jgi:hypothetical protein
MKRTFEEFTARGTKPSQRPRVTLQRNGKMSLNQAAIQALGNPAAVVFLYDARTRSIGLRAATRRLQHAYQVSKHGTSAATVTVAAFAKHYGIDLSTTRSYDAELDEDILVFELDKGVASGRSGRRGSPE